MYTKRLKITKPKPAYFNFSRENFSMAGFAILIILIASWVINFIPKGKELVSVRVVDRKFTEAHYTYSTSCRKQRGCSTSRHYHPDQWSVYLQYDDGEVCEMNCKAGYYYATAQGQRVNVYEYYGCIYGNVVFRYPESEVK